MTNTIQSINNTTVASQTPSNVPQPPCTSQAVCDYLWNVLLPQMVANQGKYPSFADYQAATVQIQKLYQQARGTSDQTTLGQIVQQGQTVATPAGVSPTPVPDPTPTPTPDPAPVTPPSDGPQPPYTSQAVCDYMWNVLLAQLQANQGKYPSFEAYQAACVQFQALYQQARGTTDSNKLGAILSQAYGIANPTATPVAPDVASAQQAQKDAQQIVSDIEKAIADLKSQIDALQSQIAFFQQQISQYEAAIAKGGNSPTAASDLLLAKADLQNAIAKLTALNSQFGSLQTLQTQVETTLQSLNAIAQKIIGGDDVGGANLNSLMKLFNSLTDQKTAFNNTVLPQWKANIGAITTLENTTLPADMQKLQTDIAGTPAPVPSATNGTISYIDLGVINGQLWSCMDYWPEQKVNMTKLDQYFNSLLSQLKTAGINQIELSFAQIGGIDNLINGGVGAPSDDVISAMLSTFPGAMQELVTLAHAQGMKVDLSFGGEIATSMQICKSGETPEGQAQKLIQFMDQFKIDAVDFDIESPAFSQVNSASTVQAFFTALHAGLSAEGKAVTLTAMGSINNGPNGFLREVFYDSNNQPIFNQMFDGLNLMLYSTTEYYINAKTSYGDWSIESWIDLVGRQNTSKIHIGFEDGINYASPSSSADGSYNIDTQDSGTAAAEIYEQVLQQLKKDGYPTNFGEPFFWPEYTKHAAGTTNRYQAIVGADGKITVNFDVGMMEAFFEKMTEYNSQIMA